MLTESYRVLGVPFGAGMPQIRHAYRQLVLQYHPDRNHDPEAPAMFLRIQSAYEYLQRFQENGPAPSSVSPPSPPPKPQTDWEKYQYVYDPPADPKEYVAWATVARERARRQKEKDHAAYIARTLAMKQKWWYPLARGSSYLVLLLGFLVGVSFISVPLLFFYSGQFKHLFLGVITVPIGFAIQRIMKTFREDIRKHFGEDLPAPSK
ncbi:DnaJ domain-containing protein [Rufibacter sediminis]|uniref:J domain-containing protein n=1 Tax=Rufibacter sediminis TaxID=2762756 RepID=A0ABR6VPV7_9BACT|nr:J domain-containing protein [Rufibacter sediminis]MBC3539225.1 J domain-containing protein [Rufibacter sediminis]